MVLSLPPVPALLVSVDAVADRVAALHRASENARPSTDYGARLKSSSIAQSARRGAPNRPAPALVHMSPRRALGNRRRRDYIMQNPRAGRPSSAPSQRSLFVLASAPRSRKPNSRVRRSVRGALMASVKSAPAVARRAEGRRTGRGPVRRPRDRGARRARAQSEKRRRRHPARQARRDHRPVGLGQVVARLRHHLRRGPAALCRSRSRPMRASSSR